jgi:hypothetical protein
MHTLHIAHRLLLGFNCSFGSVCFEKKKYPWVFSPIWLKCPVAMSRDSILGKCLATTWPRIVWPPGTIYIMWTNGLAPNIHWCTLHGTLLCYLYTKLGQILIDKHSDWCKSFRYSNQLKNKNPKLLSSYKWVRKWMFFFSRGIQFRFLLFENFFTMWICYIYCSPKHFRLGRLT